MNKLGFYLEVGNVNGIHHIFQDVRPPVMLIHNNNMNKDLLLANRRPDAANAFVIGRWYLTNQEQEKMLDEGDPAAKGRALAETIISHDPHFRPATKTGENGRLMIDAWMTLNEVIPGPASSDFTENLALFEGRLKRYDLFQVAFRERLQEEGIEAVAFNFAAGNFRKPEHYLKYFAGTLQSYQYLGFHEYGWPHLNPDHPGEHPYGEIHSGAGTYRTCMEGIRQQYGNRHTVIVTELGLTKEYRDKFAFVRNERDKNLGDLGWLNHTQTLDEDFYFSSLKWYNEFMNRDAYVLGACLYEVGHSGRFESHRHTGVDTKGKAVKIMQRIAGLNQQSMSAAATTVRPKVTIRGVVTLGGARVHGAEVRLISNKETLGRLRRANHTTSVMSAVAASEAYVVYTETSKRGHFRFPQMPIGDYRLEVKAANSLLYVTGFSVIDSLVLAIDLERIKPQISTQQLSTKRYIQCGINTDPLNQEFGNPTGASIKELGATWVRLVFKNFDDNKLDESLTHFDQVVNDMRSAGVNVLMILNNESCPGRPEPEHLDDASRWHSYIDTYTERCRRVAQHFGNRIAAFQIWNEPDLDPDLPRYTPTVRPTFYGLMLQKAFNAIKEVSAVPVITAGMASGNPLWVKEAMAASGNMLFADALSVHPYGRRPFATWPNDTWGGLGPVADLINSYHHHIGKPIWITEYGTEDTWTKVASDGTEKAAQDLFPLQFLDAINTQTAHVVSHVFWFCWSNGMVKDFGLHEQNGNRKGSYHTFQKFARLPMNGSA